MDEIINFIKGEDKIITLQNLSGIHRLSEREKKLSIQEFFEEKIRQTPDSIALEYKGESITFKKLEERTEQLAWYLEKYKKMERGKRKTAIIVEPLLEKMIGILGVLKTGNLCLPFKPPTKLNETLKKLKKNRVGSLLTHWDIVNYIPLDNYEEPMKVNILRKVRSSN
jgi:acyl-CoA synthetase (AMP-forming)/AMP-acid ligase II